MLFSYSNPTGALQVTAWDIFVEGKRQNPSLNEILVENGLAKACRDNLEAAWTCSDDPNFIIFPA